MDTAEGSRPARESRAGRLLLRRCCRLLAALCGAAAGLLAVRLVSHLLLANPANSVVGIVDVLSRPLLLPWSLWWPPSSLPVASLERAALAALGSYLLAGIVLAFLAQAAPHPYTPAALEDKR